MGIPEEEREKRMESLFKEIIGENFPNLDPQIQAANRIPNQLNAKRLSLKMWDIKLKLMGIDTGMIKRGKQRGSSKG